jgi:hypothetical protein
MPLYNPATAAVTDATISTSDITTNNVSTAKHGWTPKVPNDATKYLDGTGAYSVPAGTGGSGTVTTVKDEGSNLDTAVTSLDFVGAGVTATAVGHAVTVTVAGGGGSSGVGEKVFDYQSFR